MNFKSADILKRSLKEIEPFLDEIIIVNHSPEEFEILKEFITPKVKVYNRPNLGYGSGCNFGIKKAKGDIIVFFNPDTIITKDSLKILVKDLEGGFHVAVPKFTYPSGKFQPSTRKFPELKHLLVVRNSVFRSLFSGSQIERDYFGFDLEKQKEPVKLTDRFPLGGFFVIKRNVFEELGGFDEEFFIYFEDTDFFKRLLEKGYSILYDPRAVITHFHGFSTKKASLRSKYHKIKSYYLYSKKHSQNTLMPCALAAFTVFYLPLIAFMEFCNFTLKEKNWESVS